MRYLLIAAALVGGWRLAKAAWQWWTAPSLMIQRALDYELHQKRSRGMEHGYELTDA